MKVPLKVVWWPVLLWACVEPPSMQLRTPDLSPQVLAQECGGLRVQLTVERRRQSAAVADVLITDAAGQMLSDLSRVVLAFTRTTQANATTTLVAQHREAGHYTTLSEFLLMPDPWTVEVIMRRANGVTVNCMFSVAL
jgi:hypothetical protein